MAIIKVLARHQPSYKSLIKYILDDGKAGRSEVFTSNLRSDDIDGYAREFAENESFRRQPRSDQVYLYHEIISFGAAEQGEAITPEMANDLVRKYMELRGDTGVMLGATHRDREHVHFHLCVSALHYRTGQSFGLPKAGLHDLKVRFQEYHRQRYPELASSLPEHGRGSAYPSPGEWHAGQQKLASERANMNFAKAKTQREFLESLRGEGLNWYERNGLPAGIELGGGGRVPFSRLLGGQRLEALPTERSEEERALAEIRRLRERRGERGRDFGDL